MPYRVDRLGAADQVLANHVAAIVLVADPLELAIGELHRLDGLEQCLPILRTLLDGIGGRLRPPAGDCEDEDHDNENAHRDEW